MKRTRERHTTPRPARSAPQRSRLGSPNPTKNYHPTDDVLAITGVAAMTISSPKRSLSSGTDSTTNETTDSEMPQEDTLPTFLPGRLSFETQQISEGIPLMIRRTAPFDPNPPVGMRPWDVTIANGDIEHYWVTKGWKMLIEIQQKTKTLEYSESRYLVPARNSSTNASQETKMLAENTRLKANQEGLKKVLAATRFNFDPHCARLIAGLAVYHPKISSLAFEQILPIFLQAFLTTAGQPQSIESLSQVCPSNQTIDNNIRNLAADTMMLDAESIERAGRFFLSFDKADATKGLGGCTKLISFFDETLVEEDYPDGQILVMALDGDKTGDTSEDIASGVAYSVAKLGLAEGIKADAVTSDSGGGGNTESGARPLTAKGVLREHALVGNCTLHNINLEMSVPFTKVLKGERQDLTGRGEARNVEQLIYSCFAWEKEVGKEHVKAFWDASATYSMRNVELEERDQETTNEILLMFMENDYSDNFVSMKRGCVTWWWTIGEAAWVLIRTLLMRHLMAKKFDDMKQPGKARNICQTFLSLVKEPGLICDLTLVARHHRFYMAPHLTFLQGADDLTRKAGFQSFSVFVRMFLMRQDYATMQNFRDEPAFKDLNDALDEMPPGDQTLQERKIETFFEVGLLEHKKMSERWRSIDMLGFLAAFGEFPTARLVSQQILGYPHCANPDKTEFDNEQQMWRDPSKGEFLYQ